MKPRAWAMICVVTGVAGVLIAATGQSEEPPKDSKSTEARSENKEPITVAEARGQARLLHDTYEATLHTMHRQYFEEDTNTPIPSVVLEDVFRLVDESTKGKTHWISVNTEPMNLDHRPRSEFEKKAAKVLASGKREFELVENGTYYRVGAVTLFAACRRCHLSGISNGKGRKRVAGLVISLPVGKR